MLLVARSTSAAIAPEIVEIPITAAVAIARAVAFTVEDLNLSVFTIRSPLVMCVSTRGLNDLLVTQICREQALL